MGKRVSYPGRLGVGLAVVLAASLSGLSARQPTVDAVRIDDDDLGGVVTSTQGPEAGVWVIAETTDLPTKFVKIVVTDDRGRYVVPDLPKANYQVWVRGYGLVDSQPVQAASGQIVDLTAVLAPNPRAAAEIYPANYWYSLAQVPPPSEFPGTGPAGNGIAETIRSQADWISQMKTGCAPCHQMGNKPTREIHESLRTMFDSTVAAWDRRVQSGQNGAGMSRGLNRFGRQRALAMFANWTDRITAGEVPPAPPRPQGVERNVVISQWDWSGPTGFTHDAISTDKRNPTVNANGPVYSIEEHANDALNVLDPTRHTTSRVPVPIRDPDVPFSVPQIMLQPSPYWGEEIIWSNRADLHNPMMDHQGRVWITSRIRASANPAFCREGSTHPSATHFPIGTSRRQLSLYDPKTQQITLIDTCYGTHHLQFAEDANHTLWTSGGGEVLGWLNTKLFDETGDEVKAQGWTPYILDTNGNGRQDAWVEPDEPIDPTKDKRIRGGSYGVVPSPVDSSIWVAAVGVPGHIIRLDPGPNPPATALAEIYEPPFENPKAPVTGYTPRGLDIDRHGVIWTALSASGHLASFDRRKCTVLSGPTATGQHCPEGWTLYQVPGPNFKGAAEPGSADMLYYNWVDQFNTLGLGENVPMAAGSGSDSLLAMLPDSGQFVVLRVPYPLGFYTRGMDGRIDDPTAGWKGKGVWATYGNYVIWHTEGGKGTTPKAVKFQLRPDPLAK